MNPFDAKVIRDGLDKFLDDAATFCKVLDGYDPETELTADVSDQLGGILLDIYILRNNLDALVPAHSR